MEKTPEWKTPTDKKTKKLYVKDVRTLIFISLAFIFRFVYIIIMIIIINRLMFTIIVRLKQNQIYNLCFKVFLFYKCSNNYKEEQLRYINISSEAK